MGLKERLRARARPQATFALRMADTSDATRELEEATREWRMAQLRDADGSHRKEIAAAQKKVTAAEKTLAGCYEQLTLTALAPAEMETLIAAHPAQDGDSPWNEATFRPAVLAACVEGDMGIEDWAEFLANGPVSLGEARALWAAVMAVNDRSPDIAIPKG